MAYETSRRETEPAAAARLQDSDFVVVRTPLLPFDELEDANDVDQVTVKLLGKLPTIAAYSFKTSIGQPRIYPQNHLDYCANFLNMMFSVPSEKYEIHQEIVEALNLLLILHADHEQNCSTSTVRLIGSSEANLFAYYSMVNYQNL